ncbi:MAG TPA: rhodanese-related sulfurtransferase [Xanthomonadales bacterium]|nr:rhodanese-related sulfurtransferase [Xanthomonadales bacterium]
MSMPQREENEVLVAAFYKFVALPDYHELRGPLQQRCEDLGLMGSILLAEEGINGTVSGPESGVRRMFERLRQDQRLSDLHYKESWAGEQPFYRMKVRLKKEIVSLGVPGLDPAKNVGEYVQPQDWNELIQRKDVRLIDTRNHYEYHLGTFKGAEDPNTESFRDFPQWANEHLDPEKDEHVAMFCTGGIRCEKATSYLLDQGFKHVYHLDGGILNYLETMDANESLWQGDCFVFDNRVTVDHDLSEGDFEVCPACRMPLTEADRESPLFELHVSCPRCHHRLTEKKRQGLLERAKQIELAKQRGERHIGAKPRNI